MGKKYQRRINMLIRRKVTQLLYEESNDPRFEQVSITDVNVNRDTTRAEIFFSVYHADEDITSIEAALNAAAGWMRSQLAPTLRLRNLPELVFSYEPSLVRGDRIEAVLHELEPELAVIAEDDDPDIDERDME